MPAEMPQLGCCRLLRAAQINVAQSSSRRVDYLSPAPSHDSLHALLAASDAWMWFSRHLSDSGGAITLRNSLYFRQGLLAAPAWGALAEKRCRAFLRVGGEGVHRHHFLGVGVGFRLIEIDLRVEGLLADGDHHRTGRGHLFREAAGGRLQFGGGHCLRSEERRGGKEGRSRWA